MSGASLALQQALVGALRQAPGLHALTGVFDTPPPGQPLPFAAFGPDIVSDWSHKTGAGRRHRVQINIWTDDGDTIALRRMMAAAEAAAEGVGPTLDGHRLVGIRLERSFVRRDAAGADQGVIELGALTLAD